MTTDRLTGIDVKLLTEANPLIRRYQLDYRTGQFNKSLLQKITQFGEDGAEFNAIRSTISTRSELRPASPIFGGDVAVPGGGTTAGSGLLVSGVDGTAFSGEANASHQTHLYTGIAHRAPRRSFPAAPSSAPRRRCRAVGILIDLNGDGRLDQVFVSGGVVFWRPNTGSRPRRSSVPPGAFQVSAGHQPVLWLSPSRPGPRSSSAPASGERTVRRRVRPHQRAASISPT